jgi:acetylglutamate kinase
LEKITIKIGGNEIDEPGFISGLVDSLKGLSNLPPIIVHGGGKEITAALSKFGIESRAVDGLRVTDERSLGVVEMVLSGAVNKRLVAKFNASGLSAIGLSGVDLGLMRAVKLMPKGQDIGLVGEIVQVRSEVIEGFLGGGIVPIISPISLGLDGLTYNVNADHAALKVALAVGSSTLVFVTNVEGVMADEKVFSRLNPSKAEELIGQGKIYGGMIPKVTSALEAVKSGLPEVWITNLAGLKKLKAEERPGTVVTN